MKRKMEYSELVEFAETLAKELPSNANLVAIARGGLTLGHLVANRLAKPLHVFSPGLTFDLAFSHTCDVTKLDHSGPYVFLEDLLAQGRTYYTLKRFCDYVGLTNWLYVPIVVDEAAPRDIIENTPWFWLKTSEWVVFPWERNEDVVEGDRGLFRQGTSHNSQPSRIVR